MAKAPDDPLVEFQKVSASVYIHDPVGPMQIIEQPLIFIAFWMNAPPSALANYVRKYRDFAPAARIVFIRSSSTDLLLRSGKHCQEKRISKAVEALATATPETPVFIHCFSNGGLFTTVHLLQSYKARSGLPLPVSFMVVDSAPGTANLSSLVRAFSFGQSESQFLAIIGKAFLWVVLGSILTIHASKKSLNPIAFARKMINDTSLQLPMNTAHQPTRCYIFADTDDIVDWKDVEMHASESEDCGWKIRRERFHGSPHVEHMRHFPDRYWGIVSELMGRAVL